MPDKARPATAPAGGYPSHSQQNKEVLAKVQAILINRKEQAARDAQKLEMAEAGEAIDAGDGDDLAKEAKLKPAEASSGDLVDKLLPAESAGKQDGPHKGEQNGTQQAMSVATGTPEEAEEKSQHEATAKGEYHPVRQPKGELADLD